MKSDRSERAKNEVRVELKYCEGCGGLGIRECGGGQVYCDHCTARMEELAISGTNLPQVQDRPSRSPSLPVGRRSLLDDAATSGHGRNRMDLNDAELDDSDSTDFDCDGFDCDDVESDDLDSDEQDSDELDAMAWTAVGGAA